MAITSVQRFLQTFSKQSNSDGFTIYMGKPEGGSAISCHFRTTFFTLANPQILCSMSTLLEEVHFITNIYVFSMLTSILYYLQHANLCFWSPLFTRFFTKTSNTFYKTFFCICRFVPCSETAEQGNFDFFGFGKSRFTPNRRHLNMKYSSKLCVLSALVRCFLKMHKNNLCRNYMRPSQNWNKSMKNSVSVVKFMVIFLFIKFDINLIIDPWWMYNY